MPSGHSIKKRKIKSSVDMPICNTTGNTLFICGKQWKTVTRELSEDLRQNPRPMNVRLFYLKRDATYACDSFEIKMSCGQMQLYKSATQTPTAWTEYKGRVWQLEVDDAVLQERLYAIYSKPLPSTPIPFNAPLQQAPPTATTTSVPPDTQATGSADPQNQNTETCNTESGTSSVLEKLALATAAAASSSANYVAVLSQIDVLTKRLDSHMEVEKTNSERIDSCEAQIASLADRLTRIERDSWYESSEVVAMRGDWEHLRKSFKRLKRSLLRGRGESEGSVKHACAPEKSVPRSKLQETAVQNAQKEARAQVADTETSVTATAAPATADGESQGSMSNNTHCEASSESCTLKTEVVDLAEKYSALEKRYDDLHSEAARERELLKAEVEKLKAHYAGEIEALKRALKVVKSEASTDWTATTETPAESAQQPEPTTKSFAREDNQQHPSVPAAATGKATEMAGS